MPGRNIIVAAFALFIVGNAAAALALDPPENFFANVADRLLQQQIGLRLTEVQIAPTNQYGSAVHRIFQVTANIYDATSTNEFPTVFRPLFETRSNGVFLAGFTNDNSASTVDAWLESNPYSIPMVIGAKKGLPNFNEFTLRTDFLVSRKLQVTRPDTTQGTRPNGTNQMYVLSTSNYFGVETWNSYDVGRAGPYPRTVSITVSNYALMSLTNSFSVQTTKVFQGANSTNVAGWRGGESLGFILPFNTNTVFLSNAVYRFAQNAFVNVSTNAFESFPGFPLPYWVFSISNRLTCLMSDGNRVIDFVILTDDQSVDLYRDLVAGTNPYNSIAGGTTPTLSGLWNTNRSRGPNGPTDGISQQLDIALGNIPTANADWRAYALTATATENDKNAAIDAFRNFCGFGPLSTATFRTNTTLAMQAPFNPSAKLAVLSTWQANDPLVHYHIADLRMGGSPTNHQYLKPNQPSTNIYPSSLGRLNDRYSPWGGNPHKSSDPNEFNRTLKDPGVYTSDDWDFPTGQSASIGWLARVHRGTPWQTIYLKSEAAGLFGDHGWTNQSPGLSVDANGRGFSRTHPTNDWRIVALLAALLNTNDVRGLTSVNTTNLNSWATTLTGLTVLSNNLDTPILRVLPSFETSLIAADDPQISTILDGINRTRVAQRGQYFAEIAAFFSVPELSSASPWLNLTGNQPEYGLTDEAYEILPSQLLSLVRADPVGTVTHSGDFIKLRFTAFDGYAYRVEGSADFATWITVSEPHHPTNGVFTLTLPASSGPQFFRAVLPP